MTPALGNGFELGEALTDHDDTADRSLVGRTIGRYVAKRLVAAGGMGAVYEAEQAEPHRVVALKVMRWGLASPAAFRQVRDRRDRPGWHNGGRRERRRGHAAAQGNNHDHAARLQ